MPGRLAELLDRTERPTSWWLLWVSLAGFLVSLPMWATGILSEWAMLGVTLVLSFAALWYAAFISIQAAQHEAKLMAVLGEIRGAQEAIESRLVSIEERLDRAA